MKRNKKMLLKIFKLQIKIYTKYTGLKKINTHLDLNLGKLELKITW